jgi:hypothetical protein
MLMNLINFFISCLMGYILLKIVCDGYEESCGSVCGDGAIFSVVFIFLSCGNSRKRSATN